MFNPKRDRNPWGRVNKGKAMAQRFLRPVGSAKYGVADKSGKIVEGPLFSKRDAKAARNKWNILTNSGDYHICNYRESENG